MSHPDSNTGMTPFQVVGGTPGPGFHMVGGTPGPLLWRGDPNYVEPDYAGMADMHAGAGSPAGSVVMLERLPFRFNLPLYPGRLLGHLIARLALLLSLGRLP